MNIDFEAARQYHQSAAHRDSYEERQQRRQRAENRRYNEWAERMEEQQESDRARTNHQR